MTKKDKKEIVAYVLRRLPQIERCVFVLGKKHSKLLIYFKGNEYEIVIASTPGNSLRFRNEVVTNIRHTIYGV